MSSFLVWLIILCMTHERLFKDGALQEGMWDIQSSILSALEEVASIEDEASREERIKEIVSARLDEFRRQSEPQQYFIMLNGTIKEFIHPESSVESYQHYLQAWEPRGIRIDDEEIYTQFVQTAVNLKREGLLSGASMSTIVPFAIEGTLREYLGGFPSPDILKNHSFYAFYGQEGIRSISEFKGKNKAVCSQIAPTAHNLLRFAGFDSTLIYSWENLLGDEQFSHVYNLFNTENQHFIFDPTNPALVFNEQERSIGTFPAIYPVSQEEFQGIISKSRAIEVIHNNVILNADGTFRLQEMQTRVYSGE